MEPDPISTPDVTSVAVPSAFMFTVAAEGFGDRAYHSDGRLVSRSEPGAVIHDPQTILARALQMVKEQTVTCVDGSQLPMRVDTICVHGDTPGAAEIARTLRMGLEAAGVTIRAA